MRLAREGAFSGIVFRIGIAEKYMGRYAGEVPLVLKLNGKTLVLSSGGEMQGEGDVIDKARIAMEAGATDLIFGRNVWQRPFDEALKLSHEIKDMMREFSA